MASSLLLASCLLLWNILSSGAKEASKPNLILIVADDLGWNDVGWHNPDIKTPNLNTLAHEGIILNRTYVLPICSPSRSAILTGRYPYKMGMQHGAVKRNKPYGLPLKEKILPQKLRLQGYSTHIIGKWHLGYCNWAYTPTYRGFDTFYGFYNGQEDYYYHKLDKGYDFRLNTKIHRQKRTRYSTTDFGRRAVDVIMNHNTDKPLFLYMPFQAVHAPLQVPKRFEYLYAHVRNRYRRIYSGMISAMDEAIGNVVKALMKQDMDKNTLIVFVSDNGGAPHRGGNNWPLRGGKGTLWEGGVRVPAFVWGHMLNHTGYVSNELIHAVDIFPTFLSLAGGKPARHLDGVDQWASLSQRTEGPRQEFVYAINELSGRAALRMGDYKLIVGSPGKYSGWYRPSLYRGKNFHLKKSRDETLRLRNKKTLMLFNVTEDPEERYDLSKEFPERVEVMKDRLMNHYWTQLTEAHNPRKVRKANPKYWDRVWSPGWC